MTLKEKMLKLRTEVLVSYRHQTGNTTVHSETIRDLLLELAEDEVPELKELSEQEINFLMSEVCPDGKRFDCPAATAV